MDRGHDRTAELTRLTNTIQCPEADPYYSSLQDNIGVENATIIDNTGNGFMDRAVYTCNNEVRENIRGNPIRYCQWNRTWSTPKALYCKNQQCDQVFIQDGYMDPPVAFVGETSEVICFDGEASTTVTCTDTGWSPSVDNLCTANTCTNQSSPTGNCTKCGKKYSCNCISGYMQDDPGELCTDVDECKENYALCSHETTCVNTPGDYNCSYDGSDSTMEIYLGESWAQGKRCPIPILKNGTILNFPIQLFLLGVEVTVYCPNVFKRIQAKCVLGSNGEAKWNTTLDECPPANPDYQCSPPVVGKYVDYHPKNDTYGLNEVVNFTCNRGTLVGPPSLHCVIQNFTDKFAEESTPIAAFYGSPPRCNIERCTAIKPISPLTINVIPPTNGDIFENGTIVSFGCDPGYDIMCNSTSCTLVCQGSSWNQSKNFNWPSCVPNICKAEGNDEIQPLYSEVSVGESISFSCVQPNYILSGNITVNCTNNGTITPTTPWHISTRPWSTQSATIYPTLTTTELPISRTKRESSTLEATESSTLTTTEPFTSTATIFPLITTKVSPSPTMESSMSTTTEPFISTMESFTTKIKSSTSSTIESSISSTTESSTMKTEYSTFPTTESSTFSTTVPSISPTIESSTMRTGSSISSTTESSISPTIESSTMKTESSTSTTTVLSISTTTVPTISPTTESSTVKIESSKSPTIESSTFSTTVPSISPTIESSTMRTGSSISSTTESSISPTIESSTMKTESSTSTTTVLSISTTIESSTIRTKSSTSPTTESSTTKIKPSTSATIESSTPSTTVPSISSTKESSTVKTGSSTSPIIKSSISPTTESFTSTTTVLSISTTTVPTISPTTESSTMRTELSTFPTIKSSMSTTTESHMPITTVPSISPTTESSTIKTKSSTSPTMEPSTTKIKPSTSSAIESSISTTTESFMPTTTESSTMKTEYSTSSTIKSSISPTTESSTVKTEYSTAPTTESSTSTTTVLSISTTTVPSISSTTESSTVKTKSSTFSTTESSKSPTIESSTPSTTVPSISSTTETSKLTTTPEYSTSPTINSSTSSTTVSSISPTTETSKLTTTPEYSTSPTMKSSTSSATVPSISSTIEYSTTTTESSTSPTKESPKLSTEFSKLTTKHVSSTIESSISTTTEPSTSLTSESSKLTTESPKLTTVPISTTTESSIMRTKPSTSLTTEPSISTTTESPILTTRFPTSIIMPSPFVTTKSFSLETTELATHSQTVFSSLAHFKRDVSEVLSSRSCLQNWSKSTIVSVGSSVTFFCNLKPSCLNMRVLFVQYPNNRTLRSHCIETNCFTVIDEVRKTDKGEIRCKVIDDTSRTIEEEKIELQISDEKGESNWRRLIARTKPFIEFIFKVDDNHHQWDKSSNWNFLNGTWKFSGSSDSNNYLITPIIRVESETGIVHIQVSEMSENCKLELAYFTANYFISSVPEEKFKTILILNSMNQSQSKTIKIVYSILWLMIKTKNCDHVTVKKLEITRTSCPQIQLGLTTYPTTTSSEIDILVIGNCVTHSSQDSFRPQLVCSSNGKWKFGSDGRPPSGCFCEEGFSQVGHVCSERGPICYECPLGPAEKCSTNSIRYCNPDESCMIHVRKSNVMLIEQKCSSACPSDSGDLTKCLEKSEFCTSCCNTDYCNLIPKESHITPRSSSFSALPTCIDNQPMKVNCVPRIRVQKRNPTFSEPVEVPWPQVIDNDPNFQIIPNIQLNSDPYIFNQNEQQIHWTVVDKHNKVSECHTAIIYEDYEEPEILCPDIYIDVMTGTTSKNVELRIPEIKTKDISPVQLVFSPLNGSTIEVSKPILINVTAIDSSGNLAQCQFWYKALVADCPLWMIDTDQFICTESENVTICYRRTSCTTRELPFEYKAIVCIPGHGWRFVQDNIPSSRLNEAPEMIHNPICLEHQASSVTLSISFRIQNLQPTCSKTFLDSITNEINNFVMNHCPTTGWIFVSKENTLSNVSFNFSTSNQDTDAVLHCISDITQSLAQELPQTKILCAPVIRSHTITYHVYCAPGWGSNTNLKCEKCPAGYFATSEVCLPCPRGTFSNVAGSNKCNTCGLGKSTLNEGAESEDECIPVCGAGYYSRSGLAPCLPCPKNSYQERFGQIRCINCPLNLITEKQGSKSIDYCKSPCSTGTYSISSGGIEPCSPCPRGFYQESVGMSTCQRCPPGTSSLEEGASTRLQCIVLNCEVHGCKNNGKCENQECHCPRGFAGYDCSVIIDLCNSAFCLNNGTCLTDKQGSKCICKNGFTGDRCEVNLLNHAKKIPIMSQSNPSCNFNQCSNGMCSTNGNCICNENYRNQGSDGKCVLMDNNDYDYCMNGNLTDNFTCKCEEGYKGAQCHIHGPCSQDEDCVSGTCAIYYDEGSSYLQSVCTNISKESDRNFEASTSPDIFRCVHGTLELYGIDYYCKCVANAYGTYCEVMVDPCYINGSYQCHNGGTCQSYNGVPTCKCPPDSTGHQCETSLPDCTNVSCNNGICVVSGNSTVCNCYSGYTGPDCKDPIYVCENYPENDSSICNYNNCSSAVGYTGNVTCACDHPWKGEYCTEFEDPCISSTYCKHGKCVYDFDNHNVACICDPFYKGPTCSENIDFCSVQGLCSNSGTCINTGEGYYCICSKGYFGDNCESSNPCFEVDCNYGSCSYGNGTVTCICDPGHTGPNCNETFSFCKKNGEEKYCNNHGQCVDEGNIGHCNCTYDYIGTFCERKKTRNYNILFTGIPTNMTIESLSGPTSSLKYFTLCSWVKYNTGYGIETFAHRYKQTLNEQASFLYLVSNNYNLIEMTINGIYFNNRNNYLRFDKALVGWHHVCIQNNLPGTWNVIVDARPINVNQNYNFGDLNTVGNTFKIVLGSIDKNMPFNGELSYVEIYDSILTPEILADMVYNCVNWSHTSDSATNRIISWNQFTTVPYGDPGLATNFPGICYYFSCFTGSLSCVHTDKTPPTVIYCPDDKSVQATNGFAIVDFNVTAEEMFKDDNIIIEFKSNYRSGQAFQIGQYRIIFIAVDAALNSASCEFILTVYPGEGEQMIPTSDSTTFQKYSLSDTQWATAYGIPQCTINHGVISNNYAPFYVSDMMKRWNRFSLVYGTPFHIPECTPAKPPSKQKMYGYINSGYNSCNASETALRNIIKNVGFCDDKTDCSNLWITCALTKSHRFKRDTVSGISIEFNLTVANTWTPIAKAVTKGIKKDDNFQNVDTKSDPLTCDTMNYSVQYEDNNLAACAQAPRGYIVNNSILAPCPKDTYKSSAGNGDCIPCEQNKTTGGVGSTREADCFEICDLGSFYNFDANSCTLCPIGTYSNDKGRLQCRPCPEGTSTNGKTGVTNVNECVPCEAGRELSADGSCIKCKTGTYRNNTLHCVTCNRGFTTSGEGMMFPTDCNVVYCPAGMMKSPNVTTAVNQVQKYIFDVCTPCGLGEYQPNPNSTECLKCEDGKITSKYGSISADDCTNEAPCSPTTNSPCNEIEGGYECKCPNGYCHCVLPPVKNDQSWWIILLICCFLLFGVITIVAIIWKKELISNCWPRHPPNWMLKYFPKWLQEFLKTDLSEMRADRLRRSNNDLFTDVPNVEFELQEPKDNETESIHSFEPVENETALNEIRDGFRDMTTPSPQPVMIPPIVPRPFKLQPPPSTTKSPMSPKSNFHLNVQSSQQSHQESNNVEHIQTDNGREFRASSYSSKDTKDESYSITVSQQPVFVHGPPAARYIPLGTNIASTAPLHQSGFRNSLDQFHNLHTMSPLVSASLHRRDSSNISETFNYSGRRESDTVDAFVLSSRMIPGTTDYFSQATEMTEGIASARSFTSTTSKEKGSFYSHRSNVDRKQPSQDTTDVDSDPDAFYS